MYTCVYVYVCVCKCALGVCVCVCVCVHLRFVYMRRVRWVKKSKNKEYMPSERLGPRKTKEWRGKKEEWGKWEKRDMVRAVGGSIDCR